MIMMIINDYPVDLPGQLPWFSVAEAPASKCEPLDPGHGHGRTGADMGQTWRSMGIWWLWAGMAMSYLYDFICFIYIDIPQLNGYGNGTFNLINVCIWLVWGGPPQTIWGYSITRTFFCPPSTFFWSIKLRKDFNLLSIDFHLLSIDFNLLLIN